jgi:hypothetical protein
MGTAVVGDIHQLSPQPMTDQVNQPGTGEGGEGKKEKHREWGMGEWGLQAQGTGRKAREGYRRRAQGARWLEKTIDGAREGPRRRAQGARWLEESIDRAKSVKKQKGKLG